VLVRKHTGNMSYDELWEYHDYLWDFLHERGFLPNRKDVWRLRADITDAQWEKLGRLLESAMKKLEAGRSYDDLTDEEYAFFTMRLIRFTS
jgi:hypothetical protein